MSDVYIVKCINKINFNGPELTGIFSSLDGAVKSITQNKKILSYIDIYHYDYRIEKCELDKNYYSLANTIFDGDGKILKEATERSILKEVFSEF